MAVDKCWKCGKDMRPPKGEQTFIGLTIRVDTVKGIFDPLAIPSDSQEQIEYNNRQLGKYSDGQGGCDVAICYECYIDGLFRVSPMRRGPA